MKYGKKYMDIKDYMRLAIMGKLSLLKDWKKCGNKTRIRKARILKQSLRRGYLFVSLCKNGRKENVVIHRIVSLLFIPNPNNMSEVDHIDGNKINNKVSNLRWVTAMEVERSLGFGRSSISNCCNGVLKTAFGFKWEYK